MHLRRTLQQLYQRLIECDEEISESHDVIERRELRQEREELLAEIQRRVCVE